MAVKRGKKALENRRLKKLRKQVNNRGNGQFNRKNNQIKNKQTDNNDKTPSHHRSDISANKYEIENNIKENEQNTDTEVFDSFIDQKNSSKNNEPNTDHTAYATNNYDSKEENGSNTEKSKNTISFKCGSDSRQDEKENLPLSAKPEFIQDEKIIDKPLNTNRDFKPEIHVENQLTWHLPKKIHSIEKHEIKQYEDEHANNDITDERMISLNEIEADQMIFANELVENKESNSILPVISKITLHNFKSYMETHTVSLGNFNTIVGPNGSGKSNLLDAILFVFGFSAKKMRQKTLKDVCNKNSTYCWVEIRFVLKQKRTKDSENDHKQAQNQFEINQTAILKRELQNGKSTYYFNNYVISSADLKRKLLELNIPIENNRFMILQGEIEAIALMKPKDETNGGLLEYLEEIIGTNIYKESISDAERNVEAVKEEFETKSSTFKFREKEYAMLKQKNTENDKILQNKYYHIKLREHLDKLYAIFDKREKSKIKNENAQLRDDLKMLTESPETSQLKEQEALLIKEKNASHKIEREFLSKKAIFHRIKKEFESETRENENNLKEEVVTKKSIENLIREKKMEENELEHIKNDISSIQKEMSEIEQKFDGKNDEIEKLKNKSKTFKKVREIEKYIQQKESQILELNLKRKEIQNMLNSPKTRIKERICEILDKLQKYEQIHDKNIVSDLRKTKEDLHSVERTIIHKKEKMENILTHQNSRSQSTEIVKKCKNVTGFIGRLGDLGRVKQKYDVPITAAAKGKLENIVVENSQAAEKCIEIVKKHKLRRTSFIILDQVSTNKIKKHPDHIYCIDLIECDEKYKKCFEFVLRDTILCETFKDAQKVSFNRNRNRTVTYKGELIEKSGLISRNRIIGSMNTSIDHENLKMEIERIENAKVKIIQQISLKEDKIKNCPEILQYNSLNDCIIAYENKLHAQITQFIKYDNKTMNTNSDSLFKSLRANPGNISLLKDEDPQELIDIESQISKEKNAHKTLISQVSSLTDSSIKSAESDLQSLNEQMALITQRNQRLEEKQVEIERNLKNKKLSDLESHLKNIQQKIVLFEKEKEQKKTIYDNSHKETLLLETAFEQSQDTIRNLLDQIKDLKIITDDLMQKELLIKQKIEKNSERLHLKRKKEDMSADKRELERLGYSFGTEQENDDSRINRSMAEAQVPRNSHPELEQDSNENRKYDLSHKNIIEDQNDTIQERRSIYGNNEETPFKSSLEKIIGRKIVETNIDDESLRNMIMNCKEMLKQTHIKDSVNYEMMHVYKKKTVEFLSLKNEYELIRNRFEKVCTEMNILKTKRHDQFMNGFKKINKYLKQFYQKITFGGNAELEFVDISDPFEGVNLSIMPPKKTWCKIGSLSGGEKTLASLSLVFALHKFRPSSFYVMDEIDAALDFRNVSIIAHLLKEISSQFIIISLRHNMFEITQRMIGVYKIDGRTRLMQFDQDNFITEK